MTDRSTIFLSRAALAHNIAQLKKTLPSEGVFCAVVKAHAYGHGLREIVHAAACEGVMAFAVDSLDEAKIVRECVPEATVFVLGYVSPTHAAEVVALGVIQTVYSIDLLKALASAARASEQTARVSLKVETGLHRQGASREELQPLLDVFSQHPGELVLEAVASHFLGSEDAQLDDQTQEQIVCFEKGLAAIEARGFRPRYRHMACSAAAIRERTSSKFNMVRFGLALYGLWSSPATCSAGEARGITLRPVLSWRAPVAQVKMITAGETVGYGAKYCATQNMRVGILPVGYADGYARATANMGYVLISGVRCKILGVICMNMMMVDVSGAPNVRAGDEATLIGQSHSEAITADDLAMWSGTIPYEVTTRLAASITRQMAR